MRQKTAFTLIELLIVILIVAILASVAVPIMQGARKRAIATEAITTMSMIRNAERLYYVEYGEYTSSPFALFKYVNEGSYFPDLRGTYFSDMCYLGVGGGWKIVETTWDDIEHRQKYLIKCFPYLSKPCSVPAPKADEVIGWGDDKVIVMDQDGNIRSNIEGLGFDHIIDGDYP